MNINPSAAAASIAGTSRAAARGGEADSQAVESTRQQATADKPGGKSADSNAIDAGEQTGDRHGNGRQLLDQFERHDDVDESKVDDVEAEQESPADADGQGIAPVSNGDIPMEPGTNLDLEG